MIRSVSQTLSLSTPFAEDIVAIKDGGWTAVEIWLTKLEQYLQSHELREAVDLIASSGLQPVAAAYQGGLLLSQGEERKVHFDHFRRRLEICQALSVPTIILAPDFTSVVGPLELERSIVSLTQAAQWAAAFDVALALEFRGSDTFCRSLSTALDLVEQCGEPNLGICLDWFHYYKGPSKPEDLERLTATNLAHVQICDVAGVPRETMGDADRILPGDGDFQFMELLRTLERIGYCRAVSLEILNPVFHRMKPTQVAELAYTAVDRVLPPTSSPSTR